MVNNRSIFENNFNNFSEPEVIVDFSKDQLGELSIDVKFNESLNQYFNLLFELI